MPELPEVETIKRQISCKIQGRQITRVEIGDARHINFKQLSGKVLAVDRRGKGIIIKLDHGRNLLLHLKMTGRLIWNGPLDKHAKIIFYFGKQDYLVFQDWRKFGYVKLLTAAELKTDPFLSSLGPEPLKITQNQFKELLKLKPNAKIKVLLIDQSWLAGLGNIYAQEVCYCAIVRPQRLVKTLKLAEIKKIYTCLRKILLAAIKNRGSSVDAGYLDGFGQPGENSKVLKIYNQKNKNCKQCGSKILNIKLGGRSTRYCPTCQK